MRELDSCRTQSDLNNDTMHTRSQKNPAISWCATLYFVYKESVLFVAGEYSQLQPLAERQQRMLQDLIDSEKRFRDVLKANDTLEKRLERANEDLKFERAKTKHFENRYSDLILVCSIVFKLYSNHSSVLYCSLIFLIVL